MSNLVYASADEEKKLQPWRPNPTTQAKQLKIWDWLLDNDNGWRPDPQGRPSIFGEKDGVRVRYNFGLRSLVFAEKVPLTEEERKLCPNKTMKWRDVKKRRYGLITMTKSGPSFGKKTSREKKPTKKSQKEEDNG